MHLLIERRISRALFKYFRIDNCRQIIKLQTIVLKGSSTVICKYHHMQCNSFSRLNSTEIFLNEAFWRTRQNFHVRNLNTSKLPQLREPPAASVWLCWKLSLFIIITLRIYSDDTKTVMATIRFRLLFQASRFRSMDKLLKLN